MAFSGTVRIGDLDDFIGPGLECTKPVPIGKTKKGKVEIHGRVKRNKDGSYSDSSGKKLEKAKITLADCLACSGCVTSAETVLITAQSLGEFYSVLAKKTSKVVVTLSPQSRSSLAARFSVDELVVIRGLRAVLARLGVWKTRDLTPFRDIALDETKKEFLLQYSEKKGTLLCSACPGFVCYAEKTQGDLMVPMLSKVRSPQQISGMSLKRAHPDEDIYHVTVMPCFDKKLEAARYDFQLESDGKVVKDVDCVLATTEIEKLLVDNLKDEDFATVATEGFDENDFVYSHLGGGSGGYLDNIFRSAAKILFDQDVPTIPVFTKIRNNKDFLETNLTVDGEVKAKRFAKAYGFRSIQNLVTRLKQKRGNMYDYIEVMACPSGCLNGGAQIRYDDREANESILSHITAAYDALESYSPLECEQLGPTFTELSKIDKSSLYTQFRALQKEENALTIKW